MAQYNYTNATIQFDNSGGTLQNMTQYVRGNISIKRQAGTVESTPFGQAWAQHIATGMKNLQPVTLTGFYDDTASTGPDVIFNAVGNTTTRTLTVTYGASKTTSVECIITEYSTELAVGSIHVYSVTLQPTGTVTEA